MPFFLFLSDQWFRNLCYLLPRYIDFFLALLLCLPVFLISLKAFTGVRLLIHRPRSVCRVSSMRAFLLQHKLPHRCHLLCLIRPRLRRRWGSTGWLFLPTFVCDVLWNNNVFRASSFFSFERWKEEARGVGEFVWMHINIPYWLLQHTALMWDCTNLFISLHTVCWHVPYCPDAFDALSLGWNLFFPQQCFASLIVCSANLDVGSVFPNPATLSLPEVMFLGFFILQNAKRQ